MANYTPTCSEYSINVPAPKDAEGRRVLLDTKVMYNDAGVEYMVSGFVFDTSKLAAGWDVKCFTPSDDIVYTRPLDSMHLEKKDSLKQLAEDLNRVQAKLGANGTLYRELACCYVGRLGVTSMCNGCRLNRGDKTCFEAMMADIVSRVNRLCSDAE